MIRTSVPPSTFPELGKMALTEYGTKKVEPVGLSTGFVHEYPFKAT